MQNEKDIEDAIIEGAGIRKDLNTSEWPRIKSMFKVFEQLFGESWKDIRAVVDAYHYRNGGYPNETSPPRHHSSADKIARMYRYLEILGDAEMVNSYLRENYGIEFHVVDKQKAGIKPIPSGVWHSEEFKKILEESCIQIDPTMTETEILRKVVDAGDAQQSQICTMSNAIKRDLYEKVKALDSNITKGAFTKTVVMKAKEMVKPEKALKEKHKMLEDHTMKEDLANLALPE